MATYQEQIAQWRQQRAQAQVADRCNQIRAEHAQAARERDQLIAENNLEEASWRDDDCARLEQEWASYNPPTPQYHQKDVRLMNLSRPYFARYGTRGAQAADAVHKHVTETMRISKDSPQYEEMMRSGMELYAKDFSAPFDRNDEVLTPDQAARMSGISPQLYNKMVQRMRGRR